MSIAKYEAAHRAAAAAINEAQRDLDETTLAAAQAALAAAQAALAQALEEEGA